MKDITSFSDLLEISVQKNKTFYEIFVELESYMTGESTESLNHKMYSHLVDMREAIRRGLNSTEKSLSGLSGDDSVKIANRYKNNNKLPFNALLGKALSYSISVMEENQRMGRIVACPTAGSCGIIPAAIISFAEEYNISDDKQVEALFVAAGIGKIISQYVALAGAVAGCQAECGAGAAMSAGAVTYLMDGSSKEIINASALALKNTLGLVCDPVAGLVEVPCIKRNAFYAVHSITASELALAGVESTIPMDEVVLAMKQIGRLMSSTLKESSEAGLATTLTGKKIKEKIQNF